MSEREEVPMICEHCGGAVSEDDLMWSITHHVYTHEEDSDCITSLGERLAKAEREREEARRVIERIKAIRLSPLCCDGENNAEVDAYHDGFNAAMEEVHEAVRALDATPTPGDA